MQRLVAPWFRPYGAVLAIALVAVLSGCGGSSSRSTQASQGSTQSRPTTAALVRLSADQYRARLRAINGEVTKSTNKVSDAAKKATSVADLRRALETFASDQSRIGSSIAALHPPRPAEAANARLARGFRDTASQLHALLPKLAAAKTPQAAFAFLQQHQPTAGAEIDAAVAELKRLGYSPGS